jgi:hypothetical protein
MYMGASAEGLVSDPNIWRVPPDVCQLSFREHMGIGQLNDTLETQMILLTATLPPTNGVEL